jgi:tetratricopeptide (TPR) repeat protein
MNNRIDTLKSIIDDSNEIRSSNDIEILDQLAVKLNEEYLSFVEVVMRKDPDFFIKNSVSEYQKTATNLKKLLSTKATVKEIKKIESYGTKIINVLDFAEKHKDDLESVRICAYLFFLNSEGLIKMSISNKHFIEWVTHVNRKHENSGIVKYLFARTAELGMQADIDPSNVHLLQLLFFQAMQIDRDIILHGLNIIHSILLHSFESENITKFYYDTIGERIFPDIQYNSFKNIWLSFRFSYDALIGFYYTTLTNYDITGDDKQLFKDWIHQALCFNEKNALALILKSFGEIKENTIIAQKNFEKAIQLIPEPYGYISSSLVHAIGFIGLGLVYRERKMYSEAEEKFSRALDYNPPSFLEAIIKLNRGQARLEEGFHQGALRDFLDAKLSEHTSAYARTNLGKLYFKQGLYSKAEAELIKALEEDFKLVPAYFNLGVLYNADGKKDRAVKLFQTALELDPNFVDAREALKEIKESELRGLRDFVDWWFEKHSSTSKKFIGYTIILLIGLQLTKAIYDVLRNLEVQQSLYIVLGITIGILLLPSISKLKFGPVEMEMRSVGKEPPTQ